MNERTDGRTNDPTNERTTSEATTQPGDPAAGSWSWKTTRHVERRERSGSEAWRKESRARGRRGLKDKKARPSAGFGIARAVVRNCEQSGNSRFCSFPRRKKNCANARKTKNKKPNKAQKHPPKSTKTPKKTKKTPKFFCSRLHLFYKWTIFSRTSNI